MTKQDRMLAYLMKAIREYNEIVGTGKHLKLEYTGKVLLVKEIIGEGLLLRIEAHRMNYSTMVAEIVKITDKIKKMGDDV